MTADGVAHAAARMAGRVEALGETAWRDELAALAGSPPADPGASGPPTYGEVARAGTSIVRGLAAVGRWDDAAAQARRLREFFGAVGMTLGPIAAQTFDGLLAAALARDPDELDDFVALVGEIFP